MKSLESVTMGARLRSSLAWVRQHYRPLAALVAVLLIIVAAVALRSRFPTVRAAGYPAVMLVSFFSSASIVVPIPGIAVVCTGGVLLVPLFVGLLSAVGEAAGELTGYAAGFGGRGVVEKRRLYEQLERWMRRRGWAVLFLLSVVPNPLFDLAGIAAGAARFPLWRFYGVVLAGKAIKSVGVAYACHFGYTNIVTRFT